MDDFNLDIIIQEIRQKDMIKKQFDFGLKGKPIPIGKAITASEKERVTEVAQTLTIKLLELRLKQHGQ